MQRTGAILKAIEIMRAAGDDAAADELLGELDDESAEPEIEVIEVEAEPVSAGIDAAAAGEVAVIEAQTDSQIELMEAAARIDNERADAQAARDAEVLEAIAELEPEPEPDPDPSSRHWFYRPIGRRK